ncbi:response regulator transcription factor [Paenibacillus daejeonensis]|uniref:response regulator transcription factor n=1 Tax=Paenibacillus daejeonensis TaxID=135193 RepID=UPI000368BA8F|nr:helix-turn-helix domain-containing protein [Paenibacillus daejeonensis]
MKILIVDDEVIIRNGLSQVIDWQELGLQLLPPAESAEQALETIAEMQPDIVMTDIQMSGKTGLQLAEEINHRWPGIEVLILSGYDDFSYAQQAIRQHVGDYLLKTSRPEEIIKAVMKAKQRLSARKSEQAQAQSQEREECVRLIQQWTVTGTVPMSSDPLYEEACKVLNSLGQGSGNQLRVVRFEAGGWEGARTNQALLLFALDNMLNETFTSVTFVHEQRLVAWLSLPVATDQAVAGVQAFVGKASSLLKCELFAAISSPAACPQGLSAAYREASLTAGYRGWLSEPSLAFEHINGRTGGRTRLLSEEEQRLWMLLLDDDLPGLKGWADDYIASLLSESSASLETMEAALDAAVASSRLWLGQVLAATGRENAVTESLPAAGTVGMQSARERLFEQLHRVMKAYHYELSDSQKGYVGRAMAYIESNLGGNVSLQQVARVVHLNPTHFSEVFKKETGQTFADYVVRRKISRARDVLTTSPVKVSEVAAQVGYEDVKYFSQIFKKHTGMTPSEYREKA